MDCEGSQFSKEEIATRCNDDMVAIKLQWHDGTIMIKENDASPYVLSRISRDHKCSPDPSLWYFILFVFLFDSKIQFSN